VPSSDTGSSYEPPPSADLDRILTVPNVLTLGRLLCLPLFLWLLFGRGDRLAAAVLLGVLGATDWCDGYIARHFHQESNFGRLFDPTVDRLLFFVAVGAMIVDGSAPLWFSIAVLAREVTVAAITVVLTALGAEPVHVTWFGKAGTFLLMCAFPWFLASASTFSLAPAFGVAAWLVGLPGIVLSYYAAFAYVPTWRRNLRAARARRADTVKLTGS
jgi:cardiolipin synthase